VSEQQTHGLDELEDNGRGPVGLVLAAGDASAQARSTPLRRRPSAVGENMSYLAGGARVRPLTTNRVKQQPGGGLCIRARATHPCIASCIRSS
jgi:hypothetical protein